MRRCEHCGTTLGEIQRSSAAPGSSYLCEDCHSAATKTTTSKKQAAKKLASLPSSSSPCPSSLVPCPTEEKEEPEVEQLLALHEQGKIEPEPVTLPPVPEGAPKVVHQVADLFELVQGLRLYAADDRPIPFATRWVAGRLGVPRATVSRALKVLVDAGVLEHAGTLPARGKRGTSLYAPAEAAKPNVVPIRRAS